MKKSYLVLAAALVPFLAGCPFGGTEPDKSPANITLNPAGPLTLASGATQQFEPTITTKSGETLTGITVNYTSSNTTVLANTGGTAVFTAAKTGTATVTATVDGANNVTATVSVTVTPGAAAKVVMKTQPGGAVSGQTLTPQPAVEIQDAAGNVVTDASANVTATIASGGGTLNGTATVAASNGVATFTNLAVRGTAGGRTLSFAANGMTSATSTSFNITTDPVAVALGVSPNTTQSVASNTTLQLTGTLKNADSAAVSGTITWATKDATVATISTSGVVTGVKVGSTKVLAKSGNLASDSLTINVTPGAATKLAIQRQPAGAQTGVAFTQQPIIQIQDANSNVVTSSTANVTAAIFSGTGTLSGTATIAAVSGIATYTNLAIGTNTGDHTIRFTSGALTAVTSATITVSNNPPTIALSGNSATFTVAKGGTASAAQQINVTNSGSGTLNNLVRSIDYGAGPTGWVTATLAGTTAPTSISISVAPGALNTGTYNATVTLSSSVAGNTPTISVTMNVGDYPAKIEYGSATAKIIRLDIAGTATPTKTAFDGTGATMGGATYTFASRATSIATVDGSGVITAVAAGETFVVASTQGGAADSVYIQVLPATGPVLYTDVTKMNFKNGDAVTVKVYLDMRGATLGSAHFSVSYPGDFFTGFLNYGSFTNGANMTPQVATTGTGVLSVTAADANGKTGIVEIVSLSFTIPSSGQTPPRYGFLTLLPLDVVALDYSSLTASVVRLRYPMILVP